MALSRRRSAFPIALLVTIAAVTGVGAQGMGPADAALVERLRQGGYVLVMRHAASPSTAPDRSSAHPDNVNLERELSADGRTSAAAMGAALRSLRIPIGQILSSPTFRAMETARLIDAGAPTVVDSLGDGGQSMSALGDRLVAALRQRAAEPPAAGTNTLVITHSPNIAGAFPDLRPAIAEGEALVLRPDGRGGAVVVSRVPVERWPALAGRP